MHVKNSAATLQVSDFFFKEKEKVSTELEVRRPSAGLPYSLGCKFLEVSKHDLSSLCPSITYENAQQMTLSTIK